MLFQDPQPLPNAIADSGFGAHGDDACCGALLMLVPLVVFAAWTIHGPARRPLHRRVWRPLDPTRIARLRRPHRSTPRSTPDTGGGRQAWRVALPVGALLLILVAPLLGAPFDLERSPANREFDAAVCLLLLWGALLAVLPRFSRPAAGPCRA